MSPLQAKSTPSLRSYLQATTPMRAMVAPVAMAGLAGMPKVGRVQWHMRLGRLEWWNHAAPSQTHSFPALLFAGDNADAGDGGVGGDGGAGGDAEGGQNAGRSFGWLARPR